MPGAGDAYGSDPARAKQHVQRANLRLPYGTGGKNARPPGLFAGILDG
jgi:hypothetical protein